MQIGNEKAIRFISAVKFAFPPEGICLGKVWEILYLLVGLAAKYLNTWKYFSQVSDERAPKMKQLRNKPDAQT